jgi:3-deoxy-manno-octulosonate cytidylyltransferase (CMP-KDO synthetase)
LKHTVKVVGIIPCRFGAVRFPGKPIALIHGKPMVWHVYQQAMKARALTDVIVATDDERISDVCRKLDIPTIMTRNDHQTGTDRLAECVASIDADFYVNVQGDEPMIAPGAIDIVAQAIAATDDPLVLASNGFKRIQTADELTNPGAVKVKLSPEGMALAYSREPIGNQRDGSVEYYRQLGLYAFRKHGLETFAALSPGPIEQSLHVEMLRFVEHDYCVAMVQVPDDDAIPVDTPADLEKVSKMMTGRDGAEVATQCKPNPRTLALKLHAERGTSL